jgi:hypothetical protein
MEGGDGEINCFIRAAENCLAHVGQEIRAGVPGGVLVSIALLTAGWDLPVAVADEGTPVVTNCDEPPQVRPEHIILTCADATLAVDKIV